MRMPNKRKAFELTELCYDNLETALALTDLLSKNLVSNKKIRGCYRYNSVKY